ncbi:sensor histidine kinase [Halioxenophilus aromaticivorans]|uniref:histidine kinase n=1 Tax=Halioxenophilus aromaticivorans TaxID=1306992 RepID=A0AAV3U2B4_9ALTE
MTISSILHAISTSYAAMPSVTSRRDVIRSMVKTFSGADYFVFCGRIGSDYIFNEYLNFEYSEHELINFQIFKDSYVNYFAEDQWRVENPSQNAGDSTGDSTGDSGANFGTVATCGLKNELDGQVYAVLLAWKEAKQPDLEDLNNIALILSDQNLMVALQKRELPVDDETVEAERFIELGKMVASVTHEVNTPLGISVTAVSHLKEATKALETDYKEGALTEDSLVEFMEEVDDVCNMLDFNLDRAVGLIKDFKGSAVSQSSDRLASFNLIDLLDKVLSSTRPYLKGQGVKIETEFSDKNGFFMNSFQGAIIQVVTNLIFNASVHAFPDTPEPLIKIHLDAGDQSDTAVLKVVDNGAGIPASIQRAVFQPYFTTRRDKGGSGLGLAIVKSLLENKLQGQIVLETEAGVGTTFTVTLPLAIADVCLIDSHDAQ